jgi:hypothetical protein
VPWIWIGAGGLALLGTGAAIAAVHYDGTMQDIEDERQATGIDRARFGAYRDATDSRDFYRTSAIVLGGAVVTAGVALGPIRRRGSPPRPRHQWCRGSRPILR